MEIGRWYKGRYKSLFCFTKTLSNEAICGYGFDVVGNWTDATCLWSPTSREATKEEIQSALIKEAERKGLWPDTSIKCHIDTNSKDSLNKGHYDPHWDGERLWSKNGVIFYNGQWAEIVEEKPKVKISVVMNKPIKTEKPTITVSDIKRNELGKIYRINSKFYCHIGNTITECNSIEDCLTKFD